MFARKKESVFFRSRICLKKLNQASMEDAELASKMGSRRSRRLASSGPPIFSDLGKDGGARLSTISENEGLEGVPAAIVGDAVGVQTESTPSCVELASAIDAGDGVLTDEDSRELRVSADFDRLSATFQVRNSGVADDLGDGSGVAGGVLVSASSPVSSSPLPCILPAVDANFGKGGATSLSGLSGQLIPSSVVSCSEGGEMESAAVLAATEGWAGNAMPPLVSSDCYCHPAIVSVLSSDLIEDAAGSSGAS
ncbi:hypothetical protein Dimus_036602 [Dionaea muscipula]